MADLELNFLRDLEVVCDGEPLALPPSRKTRALLAYLALNPRPFRREYLCELLWEVPDDPRGSLRWSLSKLRRLVDSEDRQRIIADRQFVRFDPGGVAIDVLSLRALAEQQLDVVELQLLEDAATRFSGNFLEGLELSSFHNFHAWCIAERELVNQAQARILQELLRRLGNDPVRALPWAHRLVALIPYDETARSYLIRQLVALRRAEEAEQQFQLGIRMLQEVGASSSGQLYAAWRGKPSAVVQASAAVVAPVVPAVGSNRLIGRDGEADSLIQAFSRVRCDRRCQFTLLRGDPGMGKTRLLDTVVAALAQTGALVLQASAFESEVIRPFALWIDALRKFDPEVAASIIVKGAHQDRDHLFAALSELVSNETARQPLVLVFDDWHWCDESSAAALHYVARMNLEQPLLGILAGRDDELWDNVGVQQTLRGLRRDGLLWEIQLSPLAPDFLCQLIQDQVPGADYQRLSRQCGGSPLLAIELARAEVTGGGAGSLRELVRDRLSRFDIDTIELLHWAAVLSPQIDRNSLARTSGMTMERVEQALQYAERQAMLSPADRGYQFSHNLIARSVYEDLPTARRRVMHRRVAEQLEQDIALDLAHATALAHHATQSGDAGLAARGMVAAGRLCLRFFANDDAVALARKGLLLADRLSDGEQVRVMLDLHDILLAAAPLEDWDAAARSYVALAEQALDHGELSHARLGYQMASYVRWVHGEWARAREESLEAERVSRGACDKDQIIGMAETAKCLALLERDLNQADAMSMEAQARALRRRISHYAIPMALGILRYHENKLPEAEQLFKDARTLCKAAGDRLNEYQANEYLAMIEIECGHYDLAREYSQILLTLGEKLRYGSEGPFARALDALCGHAVGEPETSLEAALGELREVDAKYRLAYTLTRAALLDLERDHYTSAIGRATEALQYACLLERKTEMILAHLVLAQGYRARTDEQAWRNHYAAVEQLQQSPVAGWARSRARHLLASVP